MRTRVPVPVRKAWRKLRSAPPALLVALGVAVCVGLWLAANALVQLARKPTEIFTPVSGSLNKLPAETWRSYEPIFRAHATATMTPDLLAALAQVEGAGNPVARTPWRWRLTEDPFDVYRPASSAVGMFQITNGTYQQAKRFCIHDNEVAEDGPWYDWRSCWFNWLYVRVVPSHAAEMTSAFLDKSVDRTLNALRIRNTTLRQKQDLAAIMHLCGVAAGEAFARRGFRLASNQRCGGQNVGAYLGQLYAVQRTFATLAR
ncbi:MAG: hypothetical protein WD775_05740 [Burkholderiales bacterium]